MREFKGPNKKCHQEFEAWRDQHPHGFVLNLRTQATAMLHRGACIHLRFRSEEPILLTRKPKYCSVQQSEVELWAKGKGVSVVRCGSCDV